MLTNEEANRRNVAVALGVVLTYTALVFGCGVAIGLWWGLQFTS